MNLAEWHEQLHAHFHQLYQERSQEGVRPVFALEHGLDDREIAQLKQDVRAYIQSFRPNKHWLPWIVYAAELGYDYIGYEYWQTFEESTNGWLQNGDRYYLRDKFRSFCKDYGGARPTGLWAQHFTIICYPITHAVLPKDFQRQLAKVLYETRRLFTSAVLKSPDQLGTLIAAYSTDQTDRFQRFVQNVDLVGLIAQELLSHHEQDTSTILLRNTLQRIVRDLEHERNARDWLRDARNYAARATETRGLSGVSRVYGSSTTSRSHTSATQPTIEPSLILRRCDYTLWKVLLEVPDFVPVLIDHPSMRTFLTNSRCTVKGAEAGYRFARGQLLGYGPQEVPLRTLPSPEDADLLRFEGSVPDELQNLLNTEFRFDVRTLVLCRIAADGCAYQMRSLIVRPERSYIILSNSPVSTNALYRSIKVSCANVSAVHLDMPEQVTREQQLHLEKLGFTVARKVCISPIGFAAASWDQEGCGEWLADEAPCIAIQVDHSIDAILLNLDGEEGRQLEIPVRESNSPIYIELPLLSVGKHQLHVASRSCASEPYEELGLLEVAIREPRPWKSGVNNQGALIVIVEPRGPSLEQLWEGRVNIELHGPEGHSVTCSATFFGKDLDQPLLTVKSLFTVQLPLKASTWKARINEQLVNSLIQNAAELAYACRLSFDAGELGLFSINCEREVHPLRWIIERDDDSYLLTLSDDSGSDSLTTVTHYDFTKPDMPIPILGDHSFHRHRVPPSGGLYIARFQQTQCSIIVPREVQTVFKTTAEMMQLKFTPQFRNHERNLVSLGSLIHLYELWAKSHATGSVIANWDKRKVLEALSVYIFSLIDNSKTWASAEAGFLRTSDFSDAAEQLSRAVSNAQDVRRGIMIQCDQEVARRKSGSTDVATPREHAGRFAWTMRHLIQPIRPMSLQQSGSGMTSRVLRGAPWQAEFVLRLASAPESLREWAGEWFEAGLSAVLLNTTLARGARFLVLITDRIQRTDLKLQTSLYAGWEWL